MVSAIIAGLIGAYFLASLALRAANVWLIAQPSYQIPFEEIELVNPVPDWYVGGQKSFLEDVRKRAGASRSLPVLGTNRDQITAMFTQSPWVEDVIRVSFPPQALRVELRYRVPVAHVNVIDDKSYLLDRSATILPWNDVNLRSLGESGRLIRIYDKVLTPPLNPQSGVIWRPKAGMADIAPGNLRIPSAAKLAEFLVKNMRAVGSSLSPALEIRRIDPKHLFILNGEGTWILWGDAPGEEAPGRLTAEEKWTFLRCWSAQTTEHRLPTNEEYWLFSKTGLVRSHPESNATVQPKTR